MNGYLERAASAAIDRGLRVHPVVVLMGARQVGKSTLVQHHPSLDEHRYVSLDDLEMRELASRAPNDLLELADRMAIDEVQRHPDLLFAIKREVDRDRFPGRFVLTGSANLLLMRDVSESLAGRAGYVNLWPLTRRERLGRASTGIWEDLTATPVDDWPARIAAETTAASDWRDQVRVGGYPTPAHELADPEDRSIWFTGYVRTYLERDLQNLTSIDNLVGFQRLMRAACLRIGNLVNQSEIARDTGISQPTVHRWLNLLETSFQSVRIEPYSVNRTKRLVKSPKIYWGDTGLALHLSGAEPGGAHLENLVLTDLLAWRDLRTERADVLYWRTRDGEEVDFVIETPRGLMALEVKSTRRPRLGDAAGLRAFRDEYPDRLTGGLLLHDGESIESMGDRIIAAPWWKVV